MAFANVSDIIATTISSRTRKLADQITNNNAILRRLSERGKIKPVGGGDRIMQEVKFQENQNGGWYSGYDLLPTGVSDVISASTYDWKQAAVPVVISGLEQLQNAGREQMIDLLEGRLETAESTLSNILTGGLYSDGTAAGGKQIDGLEAAVPLDPTSGTYGDIDSATWAFWRNAVAAPDTIGDAATHATRIQAEWNLLWADLVRGNDAPDLIPVNAACWNAYVNSLQNQQRFSNTSMADAGFSTIKYMTADVVLDGGIYFPSRASGATGAPAGTVAALGMGYFLNCNYIHYRPHSQRNIVPLSPNRRYATNQDAEVQIIAWAGNLTTSGRRMQGRYDPAS